MSNVVSLPTGSSETEGAPAPYEPSEEEHRTLNRLKDRMAKRINVPKVRLGESKGNVAAIEMHHDDHETAEALLMESFGTASLDFLNGAMVDAVNVSRQDDRAPKEGFNYAMSIIQGTRPQDEVECLLAVQMAAVHMATVTAARRLGGAQNLDGIERHERVFNRLSRTFATQVEALKRYRSKGEQRVYVERVDVRDGGQAIVGIAGGGRARGEGQ